MHAGVIARRTAWARANGVVTLANGTSWINTDLLANFRVDGGTTDGCTVGRIHVRLHTTTAIAAGDAFYWGIFRGQNSDVGTSVVGSPSASADPYEDWMYWTEFTAGPGAGAGAGPGYFPGGTGASYEVDIRAKRKIPQLQQTLIMSTGLAGVATYPFTVAYAISTILILP
jgi:hypothetical protein